MKKIYIHMMMLAAMVVAGAAMTSCQKEEVATGKFKMSINATMAGGNSKALSIEGTTLNATWAEGEQVTVYKGEAEIGTLTAQSAGESTTLDGTITGTIATNDVLTLKFCSPDKYTSQDGTLEYIAANCDYATASVTVSSVNNGIVTTTNNSMVTFTNQQAIVKFTLQKSDGTALPANPSAFTVNDGTSDVVTLTSIPAATYTNPNNGDGVLYVALPAVSDKPITLTATVGDDTYTYTTSSNKTFANGRYYEITVGMTQVLPACSYTAPTLVSGTLTYNKSAQALVTGGSATNATIYYSTNGGSSWSTSVPTGTNAGNYTVYYKVVPDDGYTGGVESTSLGTKTINKANGWVSLSSTSSSGWMHYSGKSVSVTVNHHGGSLSASKSGGSGSQNLSVSFSGNTMTLSVGDGISSGCYGVTVTVHSAATQNYNAASATYTCNY